MTDRAQSPGSKSMDEKSPRDVGNKSSQTSGDRGQLGKARERSGKPGGTVGRDVPDESKERHTEIAVEAGRKAGELHHDKR